MKFWKCCNIYPQVAAQQAESASTQKAEKEVSRMVIVMVGSFVLCYAPYAATAMWFANADESNKDYRLVAIPAFFSKSSCVYNPLIYVFMNKQVRWTPHVLNNNCAWRQTLIFRFVFQFNACIMETVFGKKIDEASEVSSKTETSSVAA